MTVASDTLLAVARGNGATTTWPYSFLIPENANVRVWLRDYTTKEVTDELTIDVDFTITGVGNTAGGNVTYPLTGPALTSDYEILIFREVENTQDLDLITQTGFYPSSVEEQLDRIVLQIQQVEHKVARAVRMPFTEDAVDELSFLEDRVSKALGFDADGLLALLDSTALVGPTGPAGADGADGADGTDGVDGNTIRYGIIAPTGGVGNDGDFYIDTVAHNIYGPKASGAWPAGTSLIGPTGASGSGTGDMVAAQNLNDLASKPTALTNLGFSAFIQTLIDDANSGAARTTLGVVIGTDVQAYDADLAAIAALTSAADKMPYSTGAQTWALADLSAFARTILDDANAAAVIATLGLGDAVTLAKATAANYLAATSNKILLSNIVWDAAVPVALTDGATVTPDFGAGINFTWTIGGNRTLANPTSPKPGQAGFIYITQDGTGGRTVTWDTQWVFEGGTDLVLSTAAGTKDVVHYEVLDSTHILVTILKDVKN